MRHVRPTIFCAASWETFASLTKRMVCGNDERFCYAALTRFFGLFCALRPKFRLWCALTEDDKKWNLLSASAESEFFSHSVGNFFERNLACPSARGAVSKWKNRVNGGSSCCDVNWPGRVFHLIILVRIISYSRQIWSAFVFLKRAQTQTGQNAIRFLLLFFCCKSDCLLYSRAE